MGRKKMIISDYKGKAEVDKFIEHLRADRRSEDTIKTYNNILTGNMRTIGKLTTEITVEDIENYKKTLGASKIESIRTKLTILKIFLNFYNRKELVDNITLPRREKRFPVYLSQEETYKMTQRAKHNPMEYAVITTLLYEGLRKGEVINLDIADIDFQEKVIRVRKGKGAKERALPIHSDVEQALKNYLNYRNDIISKDGSNALFLSNQKRRASKAVIENIVKDVACRAGITKRISVHTLRHTALTHLYRKTRDITLVQRIAGHSRIETTMIYLHSDFQDTKEAYERAGLTFTRPIEPEPIKMPEVNNRQKIQDVMYG